MDERQPHAARMYAPESPESSAASRSSKLRNLTNPSRRTALAGAAVLFLLTAAACGGGSDLFDPAAATDAQTKAGAFSVSGTVTASDGQAVVTIDGMAFNASGALVDIDDDPQFPTAAVLSDLKPGMSVQARTLGDKLIQVTIRPALAGPIGGIDPTASTITIYGQAVHVITSGAQATVFEGVANYDALTLFDYVQVHAVAGADGLLQATRIEKTPASAHPVIRLGGVISRLDTLNQTFRLRDMLVYYSSAVLTPQATGGNGAGQHVALADLADGQFVVALGSVAPAASRFYAKVLRLAAPADGDSVILGGLLTAYVSAADFMVNGQHVDASAAAIAGGTAGDIRLGARVRVHGTIAGGIVKAAKLQILGPAGS